MAKQSASAAALAPAQKKIAIDEQEFIRTRDAVSPSISLSIELRELFARRLHLMFTLGRP